jgi:iron complex transport system permease protein
VTGIVRTGPERPDAVLLDEVVAGRRHRRRRSVIVSAVMALVLAGGASLALLLGDSELSPAEVLAALTGQGSPQAEFVVNRLRLPRVAAAAIAGAGFGLAGALFQSTLRNALASPDILGISAGASFAAVGAMLVLGLDGALVSLAAFAGALVIAVLMWALAWRGGLAGYRFVLIGVGLQAMVTSALGWMITRADVREASEALVWMVGGVASIRWPDISIAAVTTLVLIVAVGWYGRRMPVLQLDDDTARSLGVDAARSRFGMILLGVALVAIATALAGPVAFVALVSAPIARSLVGTGVAALAASTFVGAALVVVADVVAQHGLAGVQVPVGIVTGLIGAPYLLWLIASGNRRGADG